MKKRFFFFYYIRKKDLLHHKAVNSKTERDSVFWKEFKAARNMCKQVLRKKMKDYFLDKDCKYFKSSKKFWFFYKRFIKTKKSNSKSSICGIRLDDRIISENSQIADELNKFISNLNIISPVSSTDAASFVNRNFIDLKMNNQLTINSSFSLKPQPPKKSVNCLVNQIIILLLVFLKYPSKF